VVRVASLFTVLPACLLLLCRYISLLRLLRLGRAYRLYGWVQNLTYNQTLSLLAVTLARNFAVSRWCSRTLNSVVLVLLRLLAQHAHCMSAWQQQLQLSVDVQLYLDIVFSIAVDAAALSSCCAAVLLHRALGRVWLLVHCASGRLLPPDLGGRQHGLGGHGAQQPGQVRGGWLEEALH
jgi:hypothetical protein